jgi:hypothetical protein
MLKVLQGLGLVTQEVLRLQGPVECAKKLGEHTHAIMGVVPFTVASIRATTCGRATAPGETSTTPKQQPEPGPSLHTAARSPEVPQIIVSLSNSKSSGGHSSDASHHALIVEDVAKVPSAVPVVSSPSPSRKVTVAVESTTSAPARPSLRARSVPSSPIARIFGFGKLAAGLVAQLLAALDLT